MFDDFPIWLSIALPLMGLALLLAVRARMRRIAAEDAAREVRWQARAAEEAAASGARRIAWEAFEAALLKALEDAAENSEHPPYVVSRVMGQGYPEFTVFGRIIDFAEPPQQRVVGRGTFGTEQYIYHEPPQKTPAITTTYIRVCPHTFAEEGAAEEWLERLVLRGTRQTGFDRGSDHIGPYEAMDCEVGTQ